MLSNMFTRNCGNSGPHKVHTHTVIWKKEELEFLREPEQYPDEWEATYNCPGVEGESWTTEYMHEDCDECEDCAEAATEIVKGTDTTSAEWKKIIPVQHQEGTFAETGHWAMVTRA